MIMRRFNKSDWMTFSGAMNLPSGEPLIANGIELPCADGNGSSGIEVSVLACCAHDDFIVEIHGCCESGCFVKGLMRKPNEGWSLTWRFTCERDAVEFAELIAAGKLRVRKRMKK